MVLRTMIELWLGNMVQYHQYPYLCIVTMKSGKNMQFPNCTPGFSDWLRDINHGYGVHK